MLDVLLERYKSKRKKHFLFYENEFYEIRNKPLQILQINVEPSLLVWHKYFERSQIFCLDEFKLHQPEHFRFLDKKRINWLRCNVYDKKSIDDVMKVGWNNPRFDIIMDDINQHEHFRRYCIGSYYIEKNDKVIKI